MSGKAIEVQPLKPGSPRNKDQEVAPPGLSGAEEQENKVIKTLKIPRLLKNFNDLIFDSRLR